MQTVPVNALCYCSVLSKLHQQHCSEHCCLISTTGYAHPQTICHYTVPPTRTKLENVRSLSLARELGTHYRMTFAKSQKLIHLSAI